MKIFKKSSPSIQSSNIISSELNLNMKDNYNINIEEYISTEIDSMDYYDTIRKDNRNFFQYFYHKLKENQMILGIIYGQNQLNPRTTKILLLILDIDLYFFVNGLFFTENYISELFHISSDEGFLDIIERFTNRFFFITIVGVITNYLIELFFIDEKKIKGIFKREKDNLIILKGEISKITNIIFIRYRLFILVILIIISFTFYYIICFNNVYPSVRGEWIKTSIIIIFAMQIFTLLQCLLETCFRFISFKCKSDKIYKLSLIFS